MSDAEILYLEPWVDKAKLGELLSVGERWIEYRVVEGMPSAMIGGRRKFRYSEVEPWLIENGHMSRSA